MIVGLSGYARSGKDEAAKALVAEGFKRVAFADKMRDFMYRLNPVVTSPVWGEHRRLADVINEFGWDGYKASRYGKEMRELMQRLGTDCGRELLYDKVWIDAALDTNGNDEGSIVVTDVRFINEAQAIKDRGGKVIRIRRPGVGPANAHPSETALDFWTFDATVNNNGSIDLLHSRILNAANSV